MEYEEANQDPFLIFRLRGRLDAAAAPDLRARVADAVERSHIRILLDCSGLSGLDGDGERALLLTTLRCRRSGGELVICGLPADIRTLLDRSELRPMLVLQDSCEAAIAEAQHARY